MINDLLNEIKEKEITISFSNGKLQYSGPEKNIDEDFIQKLKKYKSKLLKYHWPSDCPNMMPVNTEGDKIPFTLLHAGKANYSLSDFFGKDQPFYGFFYIGSQGEKIKFKSVEKFADEYRRQLQNIIPKGPYLLGGLSFGGILAYEIAMQVIEQGHEAPFIVLVDCEIPYYRIKGETSNPIMRTLKKAYYFSKSVYYSFYHHIRQLKFGVYLFLKISLPVNYRKPYILWTYGNLMKSYRPRKKYNGKILLFRTESNNSKNKFLSWDKLCDDVELVMIPGDHNSMYENEESVGILKTKIMELLQNVNEKRSNL